MDRGQEDSGDDVLYQLALALLELIDRRVDVELEHPSGEGAMALHGTLLRAFEPPFSPNAPTLSVMIGPHCISIRLARVRDIVLRRSSDRTRELRSVHVLLLGDDALHIKVAGPGAG